MKLRVFISLLLSRFGFFIGSGKGLQTLLHYLIGSVSEVGLFLGCLDSK